MGTCTDIWTADSATSELRGFAAADSAVRTPGGEAAETDFKARMETMAKATVNYGVGRSIPTRLAELSPVVEKFLLSKNESNPGRWEMNPPAGLFTDRNDLTDKLARRLPGFMSGPLHTLLENKTIAGPDRRHRPAARKLTRPRPQTHRHHVIS
jgi:hypothetical protein